ncbi:hypothetical protein DFS34DRAFT_597700 [Phlyctochytrium arcticum]|nr:hypothetical protein DFS34DRAFT_597700 [Phlyctochytrium arcticum]
MLIVTTIISVEEMTTPDNGTLAQMVALIPTAGMKEGDDKVAVTLPCTILSDMRNAELVVGAQYFAVGHARVDRHGTGLQFESLQAVPEDFKPATAHVCAIGKIKTSTPTTLTIEYIGYSWETRSNVLPRNLDAPGIRQANCMILPISALYVPKLGFNLLSVRASTEAGYEWHFTSTEAIMLDPATKEIALRALSNPAMKCLNPPIPTSRRTLPQPGPRE